MEKVYHEMDSKSMLDDNKELSGIRLCVSVKAFIPESGKGEQDLPAIILLEDGKADLTGLFNPDNHQFVTTEWNHKASEVIREAIRLFDLLRLKVWEKVDGE